MSISHTCAHVYILPPFPGSLEAREKFSRFKIPKERATRDIFHHFSLFWQIIDKYPINRFKKGELQEKIPNFTNYRSVDRHQFLHSHMGAAYSLSNLWSPQLPLLLHQITLLLESSMARCVWTFYIQFIFGLDYILVYKISPPTFCYFVFYSNRWMNGMIDKGEDKGRRMLMWILDFYK